MKAAPALARRLVGASDLSDVAGGDIHMDAGIRPIWEGARLAGTALPVQVPPGDHRSVFDAIAQARRGDVLVIDARGDLERCVFGEITAIASIQRDIAGVVVDGAVRDLDAIRSLGFPVFARGVTPRGPAPRIRGCVGDPVTAGGRQVAKGDYIVADGDGVVVVPVDQAAAVSRRATRLIEAERVIVQCLRDGQDVGAFTDHLRRLNQGDVS